MCPATVETIDIASHLASLAYVREYQKSKPKTKADKGTQNEENKEENKDDGKERQTRSKSKN